MDLFRYPAFGPLDRYLREMLHQLPREAGADTSVDHHMNLRELGSALGLAPETVCRALGDLKAEGIIESGPGSVRVCDVRALRLRARMSH